jgi:hypothetical protein
MSEKIQTIIVCPDCGEDNNVKIHDRVWQTYTIDPSQIDQWGDSIVHWDTSESEEMTCPACDHAYSQEEMREVLRIFSGLEPARHVITTKHPTPIKLEADRQAEEDLTQVLEQSILLVELRNIVSELHTIALEARTLKDAINRLVMFK